jgi:glycolate oxidase subunit GlcD
VTAALDGAALDELRSALSPGALLTEEADLAVYSYDAAYDRARPDGVVLARSVDDVVKAVSFCARRKLPFVARGAGTNLSGGCVALRGGLVISLARLNRIREIDAARGVAVAEPGVVNLDLQKAVEPLGLFYAPDPASFKVSTIGGNIAENAGGPRCLKYGTTTNHVLAVEAVMPDGRLEKFSLEDDGPEIMSLIVGSEGTLGVVVRAWLRLTRQPAVIRTLLAGFPSIDASVECVSAVIAAGIVPRVLEALDKTTVDSVEAYSHAGYPGTEAVLLIEVDGDEAAVAREAAEVERLCRTHGAVEVRAATDAAHRERLWEGRRGAYAAMARLAPNVCVEDGVVPRDKLPEIVRRIKAVMAKYELTGGLLFHAGDGNIHPNVAYDERDAEQTARVRRAGHEILQACVELGGSLSGEHGIGLDKREAMAWLFSPQTLALFRRVKAALDPRALANPDKIIPLSDEKKGRPFQPRPAPPLSAAARTLAARMAGCAAAGKTMSLSRSAAGRAAVVLDTTALDAILELDAKNLTVTAEAGIPVGRLHAQLAEKGFHLRLPDHDGTLGALLAAKPHADVRQDLLGMRVLLFDGSDCELGGKVVKNVAGYDLPRLLLGSRGGLAVIAEVTLKCYASPQPRPAAGAARPEKPFGPWARKLKAAFDPNNLLNPWLAP